MCVSPPEDGHTLAGMDVSLANDRYLGPPWEGAALAVLKRSDGGQEGMFIFVLNTMSKAGPSLGLWL